MKILMVLFCGFLFVGCGSEAFKDETSCRERTTKEIAEHYPDPADLELALQAACQ